ncbi:hypothetical protein PRIPAC_93947 [Pristionchus pacificus]|uniref:Uncharacterized protein n=1 Tax=Pristionchus pacificus TaxID=54126 RepID=A0A2A6CVB7_PRIPA|nr:hypothetical protein PRIPAC_93947 [Pristionchus pacificus]|eukprot:PDM81971.1 hypothetical protein PRIPAC_33044 [Pristionchus pacificus]
MLYIALLTWHGSDLNTNVDGVDDAVGFKLAWMGVGNAIGCPVTAEPQFLQLLHTLSASRWCEVASLTGKLGSIMRYDSERAMFDKEPYSPAHPRSTSLQCNEGGVESEFIEFRRDMKLAVDISKKKKPMQGYCKQFPAVPLYHSHVLWSYAPRISLIGDPANKNIPPGLRAPPIDATVVFSNADGTVNDFFDLVASHDGSYAIPEPLTRAQLRALTVDGKNLDVCLYVTAPRSYFSLSSVIDLTAKPTVSAATLSTVVQILRGEKPDGFDCMLRVVHLRPVVFESEAGKYSWLDRNRVDMDPDRRDRMDIGDPVVEEQTELASTVEGNTGQVNKVMTRGKVEEIRKNKMSVNERMMTEYALITKAFKDCRDKVKGQTSLRTSGEVTVVNELFKGAIKEADKAWESVVTAVNTALDGNASLEQVEAEMGENREELRQFRLLLDNVRELELVDDIPSLLAKVNEEREAAEKRHSEWEAMRLELQELNELAELKENDRLVDYWKDMNIELQTIREQFKQLKLKIEKGEDDALVLVDSVEMLEKQVAVLEKEKKKLKDINDEQLARLIQAEDSNQGQNRMNNLNGTSSVEHAMSESQKRSENMRRQNEVLQRMRERRACGGHSQSPPDSRASPATEGRHTCTTLTSGAYLLGSFENGDGSTGNSGVGGSSGNNGILGKSFGLMGNALPRLARFSGKKEDWEDFETGFLIRFGGMEASIALSLLKDNLNVEAKDVLRTIPVEEKEKGVKCVLKWLRSRLSNETPFEMIELDKMLRHQKVNGKTVGKVCEELEEWTARLHREEDKKEEARRRQLLILYEGRHTEHARLLTLFREGSSYSEMKAALVDLEYLRKTEKESKGYSKGFTTGIKCFRCNEYGHRESQNLCNSRNGNGGGSKGGNGTSGGTNGSYRGGYSGPSSGGYSSDRGGYNNGSGQKPQQNNEYGNGGARAHSVAAAANSGRPYTNVGTGANAVPLGHKSSVNAIKTESFSGNCGHLGIGDSSVEYFVHRAMLASKNPAFKASCCCCCFCYCFDVLFQKSGDIPLHKIESFVCSLNAEGLAVAVRIAYGVDVPLPKSFDYGMFMTLQRMFGDHFTSVVVPQWERDMCRKVLALDAHHPSSSSIVALLRLLKAIFEAPYGHFPVAKRLAVGVLADMMHLGPHSTVFEFVQDTVGPGYVSSSDYGLSWSLSADEIHCSTGDLRSGIHRGVCVYSSLTFTISLLNLSMTLKFAPDDV